MCIKKIVREIFFFFLRFWICRACHRCCRRDWGRPPWIQRSWSGTWARRALGLLVLIWGGPHNLRTSETNPPLERFRDRSRERWDSTEQNPFRFCSFLLPRLSAAFWDSDILRKSKESFYFTISWLNFTEVPVLSFDFKRLPHEAMTVSLQGKFSKSSQLFSAF